MKPLTSKHIQLELEKSEREQFNKHLEDLTGKFDKILFYVDPNVPNDELEHSIDLPDNESNTKQAKLECFANAKVLLPHKELMKVATKIDRKRNTKGNFIGHKHGIPAWDSWVFTVEFPNRDQQDVTYNLIVQNLQTQLIEDRHAIKLFKQIIGHCKLPNAINKQDQHQLLPTGWKVSKRTLASWDLEVEWLDGSTSWIPLKDLKASNPIEVANYSVDRNIDYEPAFNWNVIE